MFALPRGRFLKLAAALVATVGSAGSALANWVTIKNNTGRPIVVQEVTSVNGPVRRGKPTHLLAGETVREFVPGPTVKRIEVLDPNKPNQALWSGSLNCPDENQAFSVTVSGGKLTVGPVTGPTQK